MSNIHKNQILDTLSGLVTDLKEPIEKAVKNLTHIVFDFNHQRIVKAIEKNKSEEKPKDEKKDDNVEDAHFEEK